MKKLTSSLLLVILLITVMALPVFATEGKPLTVTAEAEEEWTWSIPSGITINGTTEGSSGDTTIDVDIVRLAGNHMVSVYFVESENNFNLIKNNDVVSVEYKLTYGYGNEISSNPQNPVHIYSCDADGSVDLTATLTDDISDIGTYTDTLIFSATCN